jgi:hypothetical protein
VTALASDPVGHALLIAAAVYFMVSAGLGKNFLASRDAICPVCQNLRRRCTCKWL